MVVRRLRSAGHSPLGRTRPHLSPLVAFVPLRNGRLPGDRGISGVPTGLDGYHLRAYATASAVLRRDLDG